MLAHFTSHKVQDGNVFWRAHSPTTDKLVMNDYSSDSGTFIPSSFELLNMIITISKRHLVSHKVCVIVE